MQSLKSLEYQPGLFSFPDGHFLATTSSVLIVNGGDFVWQLTHLCVTLILC